MFQAQFANSMPGIREAVETFENVLYAGRYELQLWDSGILLSSETDSGNTDYTDVLRAGLPVGLVRSGANDGKFRVWDLANTDGSQYLHGFLGHNVSTDHLVGGSQDRLVQVLVGGNLIADNIIVPGETDKGIAGNALEYEIRAQVGSRFNFWGQDDANGSYYWHKVMQSGWRTVLAKTADYTVLDSDHDVLFTNRGDADAINFTLPATAKRGLRFGFMVVADQNVTLTAGTADTLVVFNDAAADSVALSTVSEKIGGMFEVIGDGTGWLVRPSLWEAQTATIVTA